jgi:hypothetical protein
MATPTPSPAKVGVPPLVEKVLDVLTSDTYLTNDQQTYVANTLIDKQGLYKCSIRFELMTMVDHSGKLVEAKWPDTHIIRRFKQHVLSRTFLLTCIGAKLYSFMQFAGVTHYRILSHDTWYTPPPGDVPDSKWLNDLRSHLCHGYRAAVFRGDVPAATTAPIFLPLPASFIPWKLDAEHASALVANVSDALEGKVDFAIILFRQPTVEDGSPVNGYFMAVDVEIKLIDVV